MKIKKILPAIYLATVVFGTVSMPASADVLGGWSEDQGYFTNVTSDSVSNVTRDSISTFASPTHKASYEYKTPGSQIYERVTGSTTWMGENHYSRARYEAWGTGTVEADSGRVYGMNYSEARSGWHTGDFSTAKTYYGL